MRMLSRMRLGLAANFSQNVYPHRNTVTTMMYEPFRFDLEWRRTDFYGGEGPANSANPIFGSDRYLFKVWHAETDRHELEPTWIHFPHGNTGGFNIGFSGSLSIPDVGVHSTSNPGWSLYDFMGEVDPVSGIHAGSRHMGRSVLRVPFDFKYRWDENIGEFRPSQSLVFFRELIDGIEQIDGGTVPIGYETIESQWGPVTLSIWDDVPLVNRMVNDELLPLGSADTARRIFGRDGWLSRNGRNLPVLNRQSDGGRQYAITYAMGPEGARTAHEGYMDLGVTTSPFGFLPIRETLSLRRHRNSEGYMTGMVVGDILDFFSPLAGVLPFTDGGGNTAQDTRGFFPVTGSCQNNWVIYFSTGDELLVGRNHNEPGSMMNALMRIFQESAEMRGRAWDGDKWVETTYIMDNPIRVIVVGLVCTDGMENDQDPYLPDNPRSSPAERTRNALRRMAHAGQPIADRAADGGFIMDGSRIRWDTLRPDTTVEPIFATNVPELLEQLRSVLNEVHTERFAGGAPVFPDVIEEEDEEDGARVMFATTYTIDTMRQWRSTFSKYVIPRGERNSRPDINWGASGDAGALMEHDARLIPSPRRNRVFTTSGGINTRDRSSIRLIDFQNVSQFAGQFNIPVSHGYDFKDWLITYPAENGVLGDMERSRPIIVRQPRLENIPDRPATIYLQTNRGVLHSINHRTGQENWAFIPPLMHPHLRRQKFLPPFTENAWLTGDGSDSMSSQALVLLDGMLSHRDVMDGNIARTLMIGSMGWGGSGLYVMDVTNPMSTPQFVWAIKNNRYETPHSGSVYSWGAAAGLSLSGYEDLGLTIVAPEFRRIRDQSHHHSGYIGFVPGGLGYLLGADSQGRAFYTFLPGTGEIINKITNNSSFDGPAGAVLGMGIAPVHFVDEQGSGFLRDFFTADSEGSILFCDAALPPADWRLQTIFRARTLESSPDHGPGEAIALPVAIALGRTTRSSDPFTGRWLFAGTADIMAPGPRRLANSEQYIFGLDLSRGSNRPLGEASFRTPSNPPNLSHLTPLVYLRDGETEGERTQPAIGPYGWRLRLRPADNSDPLNPTDAEYVSAAPFLYRDVLYVATFTPRTRHGERQEGCLGIGDAKLYALNPMTGRAMWEGGATQAYRLENVKIVGISASRGNLFLGVRPMTSGSVQTAFEQHDELENFRSHAGDTIVEIDGLEGGTAVPDIEPEIPHVQYWREIIR